MRSAPATTGAGAGTPVGVGVGFGAPVAVPGTAGELVGDDVGSSGGDAVDVELGVGEGPWSRAMPPQAPRNVVTRRKGQVRIPALPQTACRA